MKEQFVDWRPTSESIRRLKEIGAVLNKYVKMDIRLTLRQLYYQLVTQNLIANTQREYQKLGNLLSKARLAGLVDWEIIEDRIRRPVRRSQFESIRDLVQAAIYSYRLPRWQDQEHYVELWCEKDALSSVLQPITNEFHVFLMINRGYSSSSAMYDASKRFLDAEEKDQKLHILYLGDFDPSGEDMVRDIDERMQTFGIEVNMEKLALREDQIEEHQLPPNPAKMSDSRAAAFVARHGHDSYEVDALPPEVLMELVRSGIEKFLDKKKYGKWIEREEAEKAKLVKLSEEIIKEAEEDSGGG